MKPCYIETCEEPARTRGLCHKHYQRLLRNGDPVAEPEKKPRATKARTECSEPECARKVHSSGLCQNHYRQMKRRERGLQKPGPQPKEKAPGRGLGWRGSLEECVHGHPLSEENTYVDPKTGMRACRTCRRNRKRAIDAEVRVSGSGSANAVKTHCPKGHEYTEENTYIWVGKHGAVKRICRTCQKIKRWENNIPKQYGITHEVFLQMLAEQEEACAICHAPFEGRPHIDHDHSCCDRSGSCGKCVRGLLCKTCNAGLGSFRDDPELLKAAVRYLRPSLTAS